MNLTEIATLNLTDVASGSAALAIIRAAEGQLALCLSLERDGDVEIVLDSRGCKQLLAALEVAAKVVSS